MPTYCHHTCMRAYLLSSHLYACLPIVITCMATYHHTCLPIITHTCLPVITHACIHHYCYHTYMHASLLNRLNEIVLPSNFKLPLNPALNVRSSASPSSSYAYYYYYYYYYYYHYYHYYYYYYHTVPYLHT